MTDKKKYKRIIALLLVLDIVLLLAISFLIYTNTVKKKEFNKNINKIDISIARNAFEAAETELKRVFPFASKKSDFMRIIKRAFIISQKTDNHDLLLSFSEKAFDNYGHDQDFYNIYIYSLVKNKKYNTADAIYKKNKKLALPDSLISVILASLYKSNNDENILENADENLIALLHNTKNPDLYSKLYQFSDKPLVLTNYMLSLLSEGEYTKADSIYRNSFSSGDIDRELAALVFYDNKQYLDAAEEFAKLYENDKKEIDDAGILMLLADTFMYLGKTSQAESVYNILLDSDKNFSWIPYVNIDFISLEDKIDSFKTEEALKLFPLEKELLFISLLKKNIVENTEKGFSRVNQDSYINEFWSYYNDDEMSSKSKLYFAKELYRMKRFEDLYIFINKENNSEEDWAIFYSAVLAFYKKNYTESFNQFMKYYELENNWEALYNCGLIHVVNNQNDQAINLFNEILNTGIDEKNMSDVYLMLSLSSLKSGRLKEGEVFLEKAVRSGNTTLTALYLGKYYKSKIVEEGLFK
ncbi:MAG: hypothetical protein RBT69_07400 [Spirochaetia bacterium]|jgi:tetratricopeptide (TPR) repeat protein|nr:hypothetical protein [Spirochaetia bacterium]